jgi:hypothetical protein
MDLSGAAWRKSSHSSGNGGDCVEVSVLNGAAWRKSSYSGGNGGNCVKVAVVPGAGEGGGPVVALRDSKDPGGPALVFGTNEWRAFTDGIRGWKVDLA